MEPEAVFAEVEPLASDLISVGLVAARSLVSQERRGTRRELLVDSVVACVVQNEGRSEGFIKNMIRQLWKTETLSDLLFDHAFAEAKAVGLLATAPTLTGGENYIATPIARAEVAADREWVRHVIRRFEDDVAVRLIGMPADEKLVPRARQIADLTIKAIAAGAAGCGSVDHITDTPYVRPTVIDDRAVRSFCRALPTPYDRGPVQELAEAAFDHHEAFGDEIVHLLVVSSIIHGLIAQKTPNGQPSLAGTRLLLDASELVDLAAVRTNPERILLEDMIEASVGLGVEVFVAPQTADEWRRLWNSADRDMSGFAESGELNLPYGLHEMARSPFVRLYGECIEEGGGQSWSSWSRHRRNLNELLQDLKVKIAPTTDLDDEKFQVRLDRINRMRGYPREEAAVDADALTCALVEKWRKEGHRTYFVARDRMSPLAYKLETRDPLPMTIDPRSWLLYVTHLRTDDPDTLVDVVELVSTAAARDSIFGVAAPFPIEDIVRFAEVLGASGAEVSRGELRQLSRDLMFDSFERFRTEGTDTSAERRAQEMLRRLTARRLQRTDTLQRQAVEAEQRRHQRDLEHEAEMTVVRRDLVEARTQATGHEDDAARARRREKVLRWAAAVGVLLLAAVLGGFANALGVGIALVLIVIWTIRGFNWAEDLTKSDQHLRRELALFVALQVLGILLGHL